MLTRTIILLLAVIQLGHAEVIHEFNHVEYAFSNETVLFEYLQNGQYNPQACFISGIAVDAHSINSIIPETIYLTVPKLKYPTGVPSGLNKLVLSGTKWLLEPYPSWDENQQGDCHALQNPIATVFDPNTRFLWVIDTGRTGILSDSPLNLCPAKIVAYDTTTGHQVYKYEFPNTVVNRTSNFLNDFVLDYVSKDKMTLTNQHRLGVSYVYISDPVDHKIVVLNVLKRSSWYFQDDRMKPQNPNIFIRDQTYTMDFGIDGIGLTGDFNYVYFTAIAGKALYQVPTWFLRTGKGESIAPYIRKVGDLASNTDGFICGQDNIYYGALEKDALYKWSRKFDKNERVQTEDQVEIHTQRLVYQNWETAQWVDAVTIDVFKNIYFTSNRAHKYFNNQMDFTLAKDGPNFRIHKIRGEGDASYLQYST